MAVTTQTRPIAMKPDDVVAMFRAMGDVGSIELKMSVPAEQRAAVARLELDLLRGRIREVYFFDTPGLDLFRNGVVVRARRTQGTVDDTVVKLRPAVPPDLPAKVRTSPNMKTEMDITKGSYVVSASLKAQRSEGAVREVTVNGAPLAKLFSKEQRAFFADHVPSGVAWDDLITLGPAYVVVLKHTPRDFARKLTIEQWHYPGEIPLVEISTKCTPTDALAVADEATAFLRERGLRAAGDQAPKTRKALEYFVARQADGG